MLYRGRLLPIPSICFPDGITDGGFMTPNFEDFVTFIGFKNLICPECLDKEDVAYKTKILETRTYFDDAIGQPIVRRRHICINCDCQFYTVESQEH